MEVDSPPPTRSEACHENGDRDSPKGTMYKAIQTVENALKDNSFLELVGNAWERVKNAALEGVGAQGRQDASGLPAQAKDIQDIKDSLTALTKELKDLKGQGKSTKPTYAEAARGQESLASYQA